MVDLIELEMKLRKIREEQQTQNQTIPTTATTTANDRHRFRTAAIQKEKQRKKDLESKMVERQILDLLETGLDCQQVATLLNVTIPRVARIEKHEQDKTRFMLTGRYADQGGYVCITPGLPTPRY